MSKILNKLLCMVLAFLLIGCSAPKSTIADTTAITTDANLTASHAQIYLISNECIDACGTDMLTCGEFNDGDRVYVQSDVQYFYVKIGTLNETLVYSPSGEFEFYIPKNGAARNVYPTGTFTASSNTINVRPATDEEIAAYRNLAVNVYDFRLADEVQSDTLPTAALKSNSVSTANGDILSFPHAYANRVTRNEDNYLARNAIDGNTVTSGHGAYPKESYGGGLYDDLEYTVYLGREVSVDRATLYLRADYSGSPAHDTYWKSVTLAFSDGSEVTVSPERNGTAQSFTFPSRETTYVKLKNLVRDTSAASQNYAALSELEVYGSDTGKNILASRNGVAASFGRDFTVHTDRFRAADVEKTIRLVNDYAIKNLSGEYTADGWQQGVFHLGNLEAYKVTGELSYYQLALFQADRLSWKVNEGNDTDNGDNLCISQLYLGLYDLNPDKDKISDVYRNADYTLRQGALDYHWVDSLYMASSVYSRLSLLSGKEEYNAINLSSYSEWRKLLFDESEGLWYRDHHYVKGDVDGDIAGAANKVFWSRGNGWAFAALARQLAELDQNSGEYKTYLSDFTAMAQALAKCQREDGFWNPTLTVPNFHGGKESSGTSAFVFGYAMGIGLGILDKNTYMPVLERAYTALVQDAVTAEGRLVYAQPVGASPTSYDAATASDQTNIFTVGLFLSASSAVLRLCEDYTAKALTPIPDYTADNGRNYSGDNTYFRSDKITVKATYEQKGNEAIHLFDGLYDNSETGVRWSAKGYPNSVTADLGEEIEIRKIDILAYTRRRYACTVELSQDGINYSTVVNEMPKNAADAYEYDIMPTKARYVRLTVTGCATDTEWISILELKLFTVE